MNRSKELMVGIVILIGLAIVVFGTLWLQGSSFGQPRTEVHALAHGVGQLAEGNAVRFRGVQIGRVGTISVEPDGDAVRIQLLLEGEIRLADDVRVVIAPESMFGDWQAEIVTIDQFPAFDYYEVPEGRVENGIRILGGYTLPDLSRLTAVADEVADNIASLADRFDNTFGDETAGQLATAVANLEQLTGTLNRVIEEQGGQISDVSDQLLASAEEVSETLQNMNRTMSRIDTLVQRGELDSIVVNTDRLTRNMAGVSQEFAAASGSLESTLVRADSAMRRLDRITTQIESGEGTVGRLIYNEGTAHQIETMLQQLNLLLEDFRANPRKYVRLSIF